MPKTKKPSDASPPIGKSYFDSNTEPGGDGILKWYENKQGADGNQFLTEKAIANFTAKLQERRLIHDGSEIREELLYVWFRSGRHGKPVLLTKADITGIRPDVKFPSDCRVYPGKGNRELFIEYMLAQCEQIEPTAIYTHTGIIEDNGERIFLNQGKSITAEGLTDSYNVQLPEDLAGYKFLDIADPEQDIFYTVLALYPAAVHTQLYFTLTAMAFLSPLMSILREVNCIPRFVPALIGKTGTFKTTISNLNLNFFGQFSHYDRSGVSFDDTENSVGYKLSLLSDVLASLDDRTPGGTLAEKKKMSQIEQAASRLIGDRRARSRMTSDLKMRRSYFAKGNLTTTGEEMFNDITESGVARYIALELKPGDVDISKIVEVQNRAYHLNNAMSFYIMWVLKNYDSIKSRAKDLFIGFRNDAQSGKYFRLAEAVSHLQLGIYFFSEWLVSAKQLTNEQAEQMRAKTWNIFTALAAKQDKRVQEENPVSMFTEAIKEMLARNTYRVLDITLPNFATQSISEKCLGYKDGSFYYLFPDAVYSAVREHFSKLDKVFPLSKQTLLQRLAEAEMIEPSAKQNTKQKKLSGSKTPKWFLWLKASAIEEKEEEE